MTNPPPSQPAPSTNAAHRICRVAGIPLSDTEMVRSIESVIQESTPPAPTPLPPGSVPTWAHHERVAGKYSNAHYAAILVDQLNAKLRAATPTSSPVSAGETEIATVIKEQIDKADMWEKHYNTDPEGKLDEAFWQGRARGLAEILDYVTRCAARLATPTPSPGPTDSDALGRAHEEYRNLNAAYQQLSDEHSSVLSDAERYRYLRLKWDDWTGNDWSGTPEQIATKLDLALDAAMQSSRASGEAREAKEGDK